MMNTTTSNSRLCNVLARQRSSRVRDRLFAFALALGTALSLGAIRSAADHGVAKASAPSALVASR